MAAFASLVACMGASHAADVRKGEQLYAAHCASCHGADGAPAMPGAPDLRRGAVLVRPDTSLLDAIRRGRGGMPAYFGVLKDREILDVIAYTRTLAARGAGGGRRKRREGLDGTKRVTPGGRRAGQGRPCDGPFRVSRSASTR